MLDYGDSKTAGRYHQPRAVAINRVCHLRMMGPENDQSHVRTYQTGGMPDEFIAGRYHQPRAVAVLPIISNIIVDLYLLDIYF
jgi:hypothetical protein